MVEERELIANVPVDLDVDMDPEINVTLATNDIRRDIILALIALGIFAHLFV